MGHRIYYRVCIEQGPQTKFLLGTPIGMDLLYTYDNSHSLQACRSFGAIFKLFSVIGSTLSKNSLL